MVVGGVAGVVKSLVVVAVASVGMVVESRNCSSGSSSRSFYTNGGIISYSNVYRKYLVLVVREVQ